MDKTETEFETYEYFPTSNVETESDQFFVVQDDGTFLLNRQVQYVAQVQDVKESLDDAHDCTVYDVNPQQFFVDVTDNPAELISGADNYILSSPVAEEANNIYNNSFLLQTVNPQNCDTVKDISNAVQFKASDEDVLNIDKQGNNCTEITLSDEQYKTLKNKGWVLLDACGKMYLLDTFGLHDITSNQELVQNLKAENQIDTVENTARLCEETESALKLELATCDSHNVIQIQKKNIDQFDVKSIKENNEEITQINVTDEEEDQITTKLENPNEDLELNIPEEEHNQHLEKTPVQEYNVDKIKIVTKCIFKDIPDKMVLGKTANGKRLVAKVVKKFDGPEKEYQRKSDLQSVVTAHKTGLQDYESECKKVFQLALCGEIAWTQAEVAAAGVVIHQLSQVADVRASIDGRNVIITKVVEETVDGVTSWYRSFVTGFVTLVQGNPRFVHVPDLLHKLIRDTEDSSNRSLLKCQQTPADHKILQIHVSETKRDNCETVSVLLNDQELPNKMGGVTKKLSRLHACSACAAIFVSEQELADHQENHAMDAEDTLTIDTDKLPKESQPYPENTYFTVRTEKGTEYGCLRCPRKFTKLIKCLRHKKVHDNPNQQDCDKEEQLRIDVQDPPYKCSMCTSQYYYAASLSKHICKAHITNNVKRVSQPYLITW